MLPNFMVIGVQKAATSWLAKCLGDHPDVFFSREKEIFYFNNRFDLDLAWYESYFSEWSGQAAIGEATPNYINHPNAPERILTTLGSEVKFIASLRHPVERAYSAFWHHVRRGDFPADADFTTFFWDDSPFGLRSMGYYFSHLSHFLEHFPRRNFLILIYEEITQANQYAVEKCFEFLGVDQQFVPDELSVKVNPGRDLRVFHRQAVTLRETVASYLKLLPLKFREPTRALGSRIFEYFIFQRLPRQKSYKKLNIALRNELLDHYIPEVKRLEDLLNRDLSIWYPS